jgi:hypothetical protein
MKIKKLKTSGEQCWAALWATVSACRSSPARDTAHGAAIVHGAHVVARWPAARCCSAEEEVLR